VQKNWLRWTRPLNSKLQRPCHSPTDSAASREPDRRYLESAQRGEADTLKLRRIVDAASRLMRILLKIMRAQSASSGNSERKLA
jgi:hypothetical protein